MVVTVFSPLRVSETELKTKTMRWDVTDVMLRIDKKAGVGSLT